MSYRSSIFYSGILLSLESRPYNLVYPLFSGFALSDFSGAGFWSFFLDSASPFLPFSFLD
jgi:hypothetical protein